MYGYYLFSVFFFFVGYFLFNLFKENRGENNNKMHALWRKVYISDFLGLLATTKTLGPICKQ